MLTFEQTKEKLLRENRIFIDEKFPADKRSLGTVENADSIVWKRPKELYENPQFIVDGVSRLDLAQGVIGNCWFISAAACLAHQEPSLFEHCVPLNQSFSQEYAGIFLFRFWEFGSWTDFYIDDRLPTRDGKLIFGRNKQEPNEFWVPLFEKAYAKLKGCYSFLDGGLINNALVDFTGGISEIINLKRHWLTSSKLFKTMMEITERSSMMGCGINSRDGVIEGRLSSGLYTAHAYSISTIMNVSTISGIKVKLLRVRNPWGFGEWNGDWSDGSRQWTTLSEASKAELEVVEKDEGEFWMSYEDLLSNFEFLNICHLEPRNVTAEVQKKKAGKRDWEVISYHYEWMKGFNAGGSGKMSYKNDTFFTNPQFKITISDPPSSRPASPLSPHSPTSLHPPTPTTTIIVSLMQFSRFSDEKIYIGFDIYKIRADVKDHRSDRRYEKNELLFSKTGAALVKYREITNRVDLTPGSYVVIPYTMEKDVDAKFLLRIYTEVKVDSDEVFNTPTNIIPGKALHFLEQQRLEEYTNELFTKFTPASSKHMDASELLKALDFGAKNEGWPGFSSIEASRSLVSIFGVSKPGLINQQELQTILKDLQYWNDNFREFDTNRSGSINHRELSAIYRSIGMQLSGRLVRAIVGKYAGRNGEVALDEFSLCSCKIKHTYDIFKELSAEGKVDMGLEEWMSVAMTM